ncbi:HAD family hydrolase [Anaerosporobacter faecicola]|uniref:HAD family hydrolase n=1 Tax=Anaerosporobacter faecicola TaxID=2718714 RepID=UPI00143A2652|nr:HAD hydrolase family protein [Anaerosporobacter faecicola]
MISDICEITVDTIDTHYWNCNPLPNELPGWGKITYTDYKFFEEEALKVCMETADSEVAKKIAASIPGCNCIPFSDVDWYAFSKTNATKEHAIQQITQKLHIPLSETIAFGDDHDDIGMLQLAGKGIAMDNAIPEVKAVADAITGSNNQDGVARYLEWFLLVID